MSEKRTQERGRQRRVEMVSAARKLLRARDLDQISLTDISDEAGIPKSSAYHLFASTFDVYAAAAREIEAELQAHMASLSAAPATSWHSLAERFLRHGATFFNDRPDASQLLLGPKSPPAIKLLDREISDATIGVQLVSFIDRHFELPVWPMRDEIFFRAIEVTDLFFSLSVMRYGVIVEEFETEAVRGTNAYLSLYLPPVLPTR